MSECQKDLMAKGGAYPRSCARCGLGPCAKGYPKDYIGKPPHPTSSPVVAGERSIDERLELRKIVAELQIIVRELQERRASSPPAGTIIERFLVERSRGCFATVKHAEDNADDWGGALPAEARTRLKEEGSMLQYAADIIATLTRDLELAKRPPAGRDEIIAAAREYSTASDAFFALHSTTKEDTAEYDHAKMARDRARDRLCRCARALKEQP